MAKKKKGDITLAEHIQTIAPLGGRARMAAMTDEQRSDFGRQGGLAGGEARAKALSPKKRSEIAKKAAAARWGNKKDK